MLTYQQIGVIVGRIDISEEWNIKHADGLPVTFGLGIIVGHATEFLHIVVKVNKPAILVVERHGYERDIRQLLIFPYEFAFGLAFLHIQGNIVNSINHVGGMPAIIEFADGMSMEREPMRLVGSTAVKKLIKHKLAFAPFNKSVHLLSELLALVGVDAVNILFER